MSELFDKSIRTLELPAVLRMLADQASSAEAREKALAIFPQTDVDEVKRLQDETDAARDMIGLRGSPAFSGIKPVTESLYRADRGGALNTSFSGLCGGTTFWRNGLLPLFWRRM